MVYKTQISPRNASNNAGASTSPLEMSLPVLFIPSQGADSPEKVFTDPLKGPNDLPTPELPP